MGQTFERSLRASYTLGSTIAPEVDVRHLPERFPRRYQGAHPRSSLGRGHGAPPRRRRGRRRGTEDGRAAIDPNRSQCSRRASHRGHSARTRGYAPAAPTTVRTKATTGPLALTVTGGLCLKKCSSVS
eukprot:30294-Pelagococcus_subviridis.AAC.27